MPVIQADGADLNLLRLLLYLVDLLYQSYRFYMCLNANYSVIANRVSEDCIFQNEHCISKIEDCISQDEHCKSERRIAKFKGRLQTCCHEFILYYFKRTSAWICVSKRRDYMLKGFIAQGNTSLKYCSIYHILQYALKYS